MIFVTTSMQIDQLAHLSASQHMYLILVVVSSGLDIYRHYNIYYGNILMDANEDVAT